ncbi:MAG: hypothetical protein RL266_983 [Bacteroidota bacterium]
MDIQSNLWWVKHTKLVRTVALNQIWATCPAIRLLHLIKTKSWQFFNGKDERNALIYGNRVFRFLVLFLLYLLIQMTLTIAVYFGFICVLTEVFDNEVHVNPIVENQQRCADRVYHHDQA